MSGLCSRSERKKDASWGCRPASSQKLRTWVNQRISLRNCSLEYGEVCCGYLQSMLLCWQQCCDRPRPPHRGLAGPSGPEPRKSPKRVPQGRAPKVPKECAPESQKSPKKSPKVQVLDSFRTLSRLRGALFGHFWGPFPGVLFPDSFRTLPGFRARRARESLCGAGPIATFVLDLCLFSPSGRGSLEKSRC